MEVTTTRFNIGDAVPDWLLSVEPLGPNAVKGVITFDTPCKVLEFEDHYMVFPEVLGPVTQVMSASGEGCRIIATRKNVHLAIGTMVIQGEIFGRMQAGAIVGAGPKTAPLAEEVRSKGPVVPRYLVVVCLSIAVVILALDVAMHIHG